jgi:hypothetical protein
MGGASFSRRSGLHAGEVASGHFGGHGAPWVSVWARLVCCRRIGDWAVVVNVDDPHLPPTRLQGFEVALD